MSAELEPKDDSAEGGLHPLIESVALRIGDPPRTLSKDEADALLEELAGLPDAELGAALESLESAAAHFHLELGALAVASQLLQICYDATPLILAATERMKVKHEGQLKAKVQRFAAATGSATTPSRAPMVGARATLNVNALRPRTKFV